VLEVYQMPDAEAAQTAVATRAADPEGWAVDRDTPSHEDEHGGIRPRTVVSGAGVAEVDLPGWTAWVLTRDEASSGDDVSVPPQGFSAAHLWAARADLVVRVQVVGDTPGAAAATALDTASQYVATFDGTSATT
jgi:hypothetical protein